jgi:hypothetical protein
MDHAIRWIFSDSQSTDIDKLTSVSSFAVFSGKESTECMKPER